MGHFSRKELNDITNRANEMAKVGQLNPLWKRAYEKLADAATTLDAFLARSEEKQKEE